MLTSKASRTDDGSSASVHTSREWFFLIKQHSCSCVRKRREQRKSRPCVRKRCFRIIFVEMRPTRKFYRGALPHYLPNDRPYFLTFRLAGSEPRDEEQLA